MKKLMVQAIFITISFLLFSCKQEGAKEGEGATGEVYTCPMHPEIIRDRPASCPICGMNLVLKTTGDQKIAGIDLNSQLLPANGFVISTVPVSAVTRKIQAINVEAPGTVEYDTRRIGTIAARVSGRIEKLYVRYRYQKISRGQKVMDIYSPALMTQQQNLLFLLKNDPSNSSLIQAARQRLLLSGMSAAQLQQVEKTRQPAMLVAVYSQYSGHIHEVSASSDMQPANQMVNAPTTTGPLSLREGMYVEQGRAFLSVFDDSRVWIVLQVEANRQGLVKVGDPVSIYAGQNAAAIKAAISFVEPFFREGKQRLSLRVSLDNSKWHLPVGAKVNATIYTRAINTAWLPASALVYLGREQVVFLRTNGGFIPRSVKTGLVHRNEVEILDGLEGSDSVATHAQYLIDSESFIKINP